MSSEFFGREGGDFIQRWEVGARFVIKPWYQKIESAGTCRKIRKTASQPNEGDIAMNLRKTLIFMEMTMTMT